MDSKTSVGCRRIINAVEGMLDEMGVSKALVGYLYMQMAIEKVIEDSEQLYGITKNLYPCIAEHFHTSGAAVEKDIRTAITNLCENGNKQIVRKFMCLKGRKLHLTNKEFIFKSANRVKRQLSVNNGR